jgi:thiamine-monophosphate kinase
VAPLARAGLDLSDGLLQDLGHLCAASGVGATLHLGRLPLSAAYRRWAAGRRRPLEAAATGGEDYELLLAVDPARVPRALAAARRAGVALTAVGELDRTRGVRTVDADGRRWRARTPGHDHLR